MDALSSWFDTIFWINIQSLCTLSGYVLLEQLHNNLVISLSVLVIFMVVNVRQKFKNPIHLYEFDRNIGRGMKNINANFSTNNKLTLVYSENNIIVSEKNETYSNTN